MHYDDPRIVEPISGEDTYEPVGSDSSAQGLKGSELLKELLVQWKVPKKDVTAILECTSIDEILSKRKGSKLE